MVVNQLILKNYKKYENIKLKFNKGINIIIGDNAQGKTNILESIYFLSITKSYRTSDDFNLINHRKDFAKINAKIRNDNVPKNLEIIINKKKKTLFLNKNEIKKVSEFIGILNVVMMAPEDVNIIKGSPSERRNLLNIELSKLSKEYIIKYNEYSKLLKMRNDYLKLLMTNSIADSRYLDVINEKLIERAIYIYKERKRIIDEINSYLIDIYKDISNIDNLLIKYIPNFEITEFDDESLRKKMKHQFYKYSKKEIMLGMTLYGPHRDDFEFTIENSNLKYFGSQGQQKLAMISLKIALLKVFNDRTGIIPLLLLDDVFSELDRKKKNKLIEYINNSGQVIITTNDIRDINRKKIKNSKIFEIKNKNIIEKGETNGKTK